MEHEIRVLELLTSLAREQGCKCGGSKTAAEAPTGPNHTMNTGGNQDALTLKTFTVVNPKCGIQAQVEPNKSTDNANSHIQGGFVWALKMSAIE